MKRYIKRETAQARAYSQAVITEGGRVIWLAGQVGATDASGRSLAGDFDGQVREIFSRFRQTLEEAGGTLADIVTMTVFITDARLGDRFTQQPELQAMIRQTIGETYQFLGLHQEALPHLESALELR